MPTLLLIMLATLLLGAAFALHCALVAAEEVREAGRTAGTGAASPTPESPRVTTRRARSRDESVAVGAEGSFSD